MVEDGHGEIHVRPENQREMRKMSRQSSTSDKGEEPVIINKDVETSMDVSREKAAEGGGGATSTDQQQEVMGKTSPDKDIGAVQVIANEASMHVDVEMNTSKEVTEEGAATVTKKQDEEEAEGEHSQQSSDTAKETVIANEGTCTMEAKERRRTHGSSTDSVNLTRTITNI